MPKSLKYAFPLHSLALETEVAPDQKMYIKVFASNSEYISFDCINVASNGLIQTTPSL